jgi:hypothetical protein
MRVCVFVGVGDPACGHMTQRLHERASKHRAPIDLGDDVSA